MKERRLFVLFGVGVFGIGIWWTVSRSTSSPDIPLIDVTESQRVRQEPEDGICPWRNPEADRKQFFPTATAHEEEAIVLSRYRQEIGKRLGRVPTSDENLLRVYRVRQGEKILGTVIPRRLRGESGAIEIVIAVDTQGKVLGAKFQRLREPDSVAKALRAAEFLGKFKGKTAQSEWKFGKDFAPISLDAQRSATAVLDGTRTALILLDTGNSAAAKAHH